MRQLLDLELPDIVGSYIDRQLTDHLAARAGLMLMPFGMLNEHHEPTQFYGMQRNFVER